MDFALKDKNRLYQEKTERNSNMPHFVTNRYSG